jgi:ketosteroid isomerase-like protein
MATTASAESVLSAFRDALQGHDEQALLEVYDDDATVTVYSERNRPSTSRALEGRAQIEAWIHDVMSRNLTHTIGDEVAAGDRFACTETCVYPTGERVVGTLICEVRDGRIVREVGAEAWDL